MVRGRKPLAAEIHERNGSYEKNPQRKKGNSAKADHGIPDMPDLFEEMQHAKTKWKQLTKLLNAMGVLAKSDLDLLEQYCVSYQLYRDALSVIREQGKDNVADGLAVTEFTTNGTTVKKSPFCGELHKHMDRMAKLMTEMGMTPSSRTRVLGSPEKEEDDELIKLMKERGNLN